MSSQRQQNANRRNAQHSTGPRTESGKARVAQNARRHGLLAKEAVLPEEDPQQYLELCAALHEEHQPATPLEEFCVEQMASAQWRLRRLVRIETGYFAERLYDAGGQRGVRPMIDPEVENLPKFEMDTRLLGTVFREDTRGDSILKLTRYETVIRRSFYKALETLLDAQARRPNPPAYAAADETKPIPISDTPPPSDPGIPAESNRPAAVVQSHPQSRVARALRARACLRAAARPRFQIAKAVLTRSCT